MSSQAVNSNAFFKIYWMGFRICGGNPPAHQYRIPYFVYAFAVSTLVTICYPLHLAMALFHNNSLGSDIKNLAVCVTCIACSSKFIIFTRKLRIVREIEQTFSELDARVNSEVERKYFARMRISVRRIVSLFLCVYGAVGMTAELAFLLRGERSLLYPARFPFDWRTSKRNFLVANIYQIVGICYQLLQNYVDDSLPPITCCLLSGHIKLLGMRMARIGFDCADLAENERELVQCIKDQKNLYKLFNLLQELISLPLLIQFTVTAFNICVAMVVLLFYIDTPPERLYYLTYFISMPLQIFPICYYGSSLQYLFAQLQYEVFRCNWPDQTQRFKKQMILFTERASKETTALAGGMIRIHLDTFFSTIKGAYSLFAVIMKMK
ncbi:odorant receptor 59a-like [Anastrepha obliqua]|uniref:odorant receptor 59a-like n=1 Tax=Anastrepha obliqua TaxID=95512 RepID=UPI00240A071D|nr:odorant receptor 59a-like [Anastrepha obliqua]